MNDADLKAAFEEAVADATAQVDPHRALHDLLSSSPPSPAGEPGSSFFGDLPDLRHWLDNIRLLTALVPVVLGVVALGLFFNSVVNQDDPSTGLIATGELGSELSGDDLKGDTGPDDPTLTVPPAGPSESDRADQSTTAEPTTLADTKTSDPDDDSESDQDDTLDPETTTTTEDRSIGHTGLTGTTMTMRPTTQTSAQTGSTITTVPSTVPSTVVTVVTTPTEPTTTAPTTTHAPTTTTTVEPNEAEPTTFRATLGDGTPVPGVKFENTDLEFHAITNTSGEAVVPVRKCDYMRATAPDGFSFASSYRAPVVVFYSCHNKHLILHLPPEVG